MSEAKNRIAMEHFVSREPFDPYRIAALTAALLPKLLPRYLMGVGTPLDSGERGVIVNTASVAAFDGQIGQVAYAAAKGGLVAMTLPAARELAQFGIRVLAIAPGIFLTPLLYELAKEVQDSLGASIPFPKRLGKPDEFAQFVEHIFANMLLNGSVHRLDGAVRMGPK